jgi:hypothetical protein
VSLTQDAMMKLMAYADGEAEGADLVEVERLLAKEPDAASFVEQIAGLGAVVKTAHAARRDEALAGFDVLDAVMAKVKETTPDPAEPAKAGAAKPRVASLDDARARRRRVTIAAGVAAALALAASVFLFGKPEEQPMAQAPRVAPAAVEPAPTEMSAMAASVPAIVVEPIESPGQSVKVIYGPGKNEMSTSVIIWVDEERK